jgi:hypothetical protein
VNEQTIIYPCLGELVINLKKQNKDKNLNKYQGHYAENKKSNHKRLYRYDKFIFYYF